MKIKLGKRPPFRKYTIEVESEKDHEHLQSILIFYDDRGTNSEVIQTVVDLLESIPEYEG